MYIADAQIKYFNISWKWLHTNSFDSSSDFFSPEFLFVTPSNPSFQCQKLFSLVFISNQFPAQEVSRLCCITYLQVLSCEEMKNAMLL